MTQDRIFKPILELTKQPLNEYPFIDKYENTDQILKRLKDDHKLIEIKCQLSNFVESSLSVSLNNFEFYVGVSLVTDNEPFKQHPFLLKSNDYNTRLRTNLLKSYLQMFDNQVFFKLNKTTMDCEINDLYIESLSMNQLKDDCEQEFLKKISSMGNIRGTSFFFIIF
jgi:hypothetical protein